MNSKYLMSGTNKVKGQPHFNLVGRDTELDNMMKILLRKSASSVIMVGQGGVGCSSISLGVQKAKGLTTTSFDITHKRMWWLDVDGLFSNPEDTPEEFAKIMKVLALTPDKDTILVVEDTRDFLEACTSTGNSSFINQIVREIERGSFQVIFEVKDHNLEFVLGSHGQMKQLFTILEIKEPNKEDLQQIVAAGSGALVSHHGIKISEEAQTQAVHLTTMYPGKEASLARAQPEASLTLLDRALSTYRKAAHRTPPAHILELMALVDETNNPEDRKRLEQEWAAWEVTKEEIDKACKLQTTGEQQIYQMQSKLDELIEEKDTKNPLGSNCPKQDKLREKISMVQKMVKGAVKQYETATKAINERLLLTEQHVSTEFATLSGIPTDKLNEDASAKLMQLESKLKSAVYGQDHVIDQLTDALLVSKVPGLKAKGKPDAAFMFCGSSGVGKTELVKQLALQLKDDEGAMVRFDMSEYKEKFMVTSLIGAPPGFQGYGEGGVLTNAVRKNPHSIILFDEIEKAHKDVFDLFLQVLDDGRLTDSMGRVVSFEHTTLVFTTNTGASNFLDPDMSYDDQMDNTMEALSEEYRAEFLNRFNGRENIVGFKALAPEIIQKIARGQLTKMNRDMQQANVRFSAFMKDEDIERLVEDTYDPAHGARAIGGIFNKRVYPMFAKVIAKTDFTSGVELKVQVTYTDGQFDINVEEV
jgi:ATP-dependent Clp protease ATP-binding subunit ClpB